MISLFTIIFLQNAGATEINQISNRSFVIGGIVSNNVFLRVPAGSHDEEGDIGDLQGTVSNPPSDVRNYAFELSYGGDPITVNRVCVSGELTEVALATFATEAHIKIVTPNGTAVFQGPEILNYDNTLEVIKACNRFAPFDPRSASNNPSTVEFFESFDDIDGSDDQQWSSGTSVSLEQVEFSDGNFDLGSLLADGVTRSQVDNIFTSSDGGSLRHGSIYSGTKDTFTFTIGGVLSSGEYLNIQTRFAGTTDRTNTNIALFDANDVLVALDTNSQVEAKGGSYSLLSFGNADPIDSDGIAGKDGSTLPPGQYKLVIASSGSNIDALTVGVSTIDDVTTGSAPGNAIENGDYLLDITYFQNDIFCFPIKTKDSYALTCI